MRNLALIAVAVSLTGAGLAEPRTLVDKKNWDVFQKLYPKNARAAGQQGLVAFRITIDRAGHPTACQVTHSSGHKALDEGTCELLLMHAAFKPPVDSEGRRLNAQHTEGFINWSIPGRQANLVSPTKLAKLDPLEKRICRRTLRTGSLAGYERRCATVREWNKNRDEQTESMQELQGRKGFTTGVEN